MRVIKVLNTSVVLALDDQGSEVVLMGKGIGFGHKIGSVLSDNEIEKLFVLKDRTLSRNILRLAKDIDAEVFSVTKDTVDFAKEKLGMKLMDHIYLALTDHLAFAIRRTQENILSPGFYSQEIKRFNPDEYTVALYALKLVRERLGVDLPESETGYIAFHFINAQQEHPLNKNTLRIRDLVDDILEIVKYNFNIEYDRDSISYSRFVTHLQAFAQRLVLNRQLPQEEKNFLYEEITRSCPDELICAQKIAQFVQSRYDYETTNQEILYLVIHIHRILEEHPRNN